MLGIALAAIGWRLARHLGYVGAGIGVMVHGTALIVLDLAFAIQISR